MSRPWERSQTLLNSSAPEDIIASNVNPAVGGSTTQPDLQIPITANQTPSTTATQPSLSQPQATTGVSSGSGGGLTSVLGSGVSNSLSNPLGSSSSYTSPMNRFGSSYGGMGGLGMGGLYGGGYGGYGGMGGYGRFGMQTGNQMMDQMNQYVVGISEMAGMVEHNASGLAKFILLLKKMAEGGYTMGKDLAIKGYEKAMTVLTLVREKLQEKLDKLKQKLGFGIQEGAPSLAYFPNERKRLEQQNRARLEKQIKFLDWCLYLLLGLVAFNVFRLFVHEIRKIM